VAEMATDSGILQSGGRSLHSQMCGLRVEFAESLRPPPRIFPFLGDRRRRLGSIATAWRDWQPFNLLAVDLARRATFIGQN
jgi:hypothetical protein